MSDLPVVLGTIDAFGCHGSEMADVSRWDASPLRIVLADIPRELGSVVYHQQNIRNSLTSKDLLTNQEGRPQRSGRPVASRIPRVRRCDHAMLV